MELYKRASRQASRQAASDAKVAVYMHAKTIFQIWRESLYILLCECFAANAAACQYVSGVELMLVLLVIRCYSLNVRLLVCLLPAARRAIHPLFFFPPVWEAYRPYTSSNRSGPPGNRQLGRHTPGQAHLNSVLMCVIVVNERMMTM